MFLAESFVTVNGVKRPKCLTTVDLSKCGTATYRDTIQPFTWWFCHIFTDMYIIWQYFNIVIKYKKVTRQYVFSDPIYVIHLSMDLYNIIELQTGQNSGCINTKILMGSFPRGTIKDGKV